MRKLLSSALLAVVVFLGVVCALQARELRRARARLALLRAGAPAAMLQASAGTPAAARPSPATRVPSQAAPAGTPATAAESRRRVIRRVDGLLKQMQSSPVFRRFARAQAANEIQKYYTPLFRILNLADPGPLAELLRKKAEADVDTALSLQREDLTREERRALIRAAQEADAALEAQIRDLLGEEDYAVYQEYLDTLSERAQVETFKQKLNSEGLALAPSQEDELVRLMHDGRTRPLAPEEDEEFYKLSTSLPEERSLTWDQMEMRRMEFLHQRYLDAASSILTPEQLRVYEEYLNQWHDLWERYADYSPGPVFESHDRAAATVGRASDALVSPVVVNAVENEPAQWGDNPGGSSCTVSRTSGNMLGVQFDVGSGWGAGLTFWPEGAAADSEGAANAAGASKLVVRLKAPAGVRLRVGLLESGATIPGARSYEGAGGADGEAYRHEGIVTRDGWQVYSIPLSELKLNGGYGNQAGNRVIDTQALKGIEILMPGGQPSCTMEVDYVRLE